MTVKEKIIKLRKWFDQESINTIKLQMFSDETQFNHDVVDKIQKLCCEIQILTDSLEMVEDIYKLDIGDKVTINNYESFLYGTMLEAYKNLGYIFITDRCDREHFQLSYGGMNINCHGCRLRPYESLNENNLKEDLR